VRRSILIWLVCLLLVAALAIAGLVRYLPAKITTVAATAKVSSSASATPSASAAASASTQPSATPAASATGTASGGTSPASSAGASPGASASPAATADAIAAAGGGVGASLADLSALTPVTSSEVSGVTTGPQQIGAVTYEDSIRFSCWSGGGDVVYDVAGYKFLTALIGIPSDADDAIGNTMTITFDKDGSATQLSTPVTISLDHPQSIHLNLQGSSQLEMACNAINTTSQSQEYMDVAFGNATLGPN
jgi:hypothetical protein